MKKYFLALSSLTLFLSLFLLSCEKKDNSGISPSYKEEQGTGGNPFPNNPTVTGTSTLSNPATQNSSLLVGGTGWSNPTCASTFTTTLQGINGSIVVTLSFFAPPSTGTLAIAAAPTQTQLCSMSAANVPNQPSGIVWYAQSGLVSVVTSTSGAVSAAFSGIVCTQQTFNFPTVTLSGQLGCN